ncbi:MAG TPA: FixH family protein [Chitinophagaceae bacterium]|nr:FixH family protein [Chitinophagaceae bacterium]MCB9054454.1 FixH family protein [Chitinophagales bacterium]HPG11968.1 FixH family protein [Chitinophagaceae bacterium]HRX93831.1 FixH family protein [Chitinophagaceae bacterium]
MSWGNKILIAILVFIGGMVYLVYRSVNTNYELVEKDYYAQELKYQHVIDGTKRAQELSTPLKIGQEEDGTILLQLPDEMKNVTIKGKIWFYCAYDSRKDKKFELSTDKNGVQLFDLKKIDPGNYTVRIDWNSEGKNYYAEEPLTVL